ncbi:MAG: hypothetical protein KAT05_08205, partial [Spirochaetes bacterium]|nr:hypothetical protein [Spirochaetota bacterium]
ENIDNLYNTIQSDSNNKALIATLTLLSSSDPAIGTILLTAKIMESAYEFYSDTQDNYEKTDNYSSSVSSALSEVAVRGIIEKKEMLVENGITAVWNKVKEDNSIEIQNNVLDDFVISAVTDVILENIS